MAPASRTMRDDVLRGVSRKKLLICVFFFFTFFSVLPLGTHFYGRTERACKFLDVCSAKLATLSCYIFSRAGAPKADEIRHVGRKKKKCRTYYTHTFTEIRERNDKMRKKKFV